MSLNGQNLRTVYRQDWNQSAFLCISLHKTTPRQQGVFERSHLNVNPFKSYGHSQYKIIIPILLIIIAFIISIIFSQTKSFSADKFQTP